MASLIVGTAVLLGSALLQPACAPPEGEPIGTSQDALVSGAVGQWVWNDVVGSRCGRGQQTGFGINRGTSKEVLIYLEGGGLCWDEPTCNFNGTNATGLGFVNRFYNEGFDRDTFARMQPWLDIFKRDRADNPYKDATMIYVPYCTGDFHSGDGGYGNLQFHGRKNLDLFLQQIVPGLPGTTNVTLAGTSAGGFGATFNFWRVAKAFGSSVRTDLVADSGPILWNNAIAFTGWGSWNASSGFPPDCTNCSTFQNIYRYNAEHFPKSRFAFTTWDEDGLIALGGYALMPMPMFYNEIGNFTHGVLKPLRNTKWFIAAGPNHGMLNNLGIVSQMKACHWLSGPFCFPVDVGDHKSLGDWLTEMHTDNPHWRSWSTIMGASAGGDCSSCCAGKVCGGSCGGCYAGESCSLDQTHCFTGCEIGGVKYPAGAVNPARSCEVCTPSANAYGWSVAENTCLVGGKCYAPGARDATGCQACAPATSKTSLAIQSECTNLAIITGNAGGEGKFGYGNAVSWCASIGQTYAPGIPGTWKPLLSTDSLDYKDIVPAAQRTKPIMNGKGEQLFASWNAMLGNQEWPRGISMYDYVGNPFTGAVWTGTANNGTNTRNCGNWTTSGWFNPWWNDTYTEYADYGQRKLMNSGTTMCRNHLANACVHIPPN